MDICPIWVDSRPEFPGGLQKIFYREIYLEIFHILEGVDFC